MERRPLLVLDFDGVICDSLPECFVSSWLAYYELWRGSRPNAVPRNAFSRFAELRPYIRSGEDYLVIQDLLSAGKSVGNQADFDGEVQSAGAERMAEYKRLLYGARERLIALSPEYWCRLNLIYPHMRAAVERLDAGRGVFILSTKRAPFIARILSAWGMPFPLERVLYCGSRGKHEMIRELLEASGAPGAVFVDDQIDHFRGSRAWPRDRGSIACKLASWGYVRPEWLSGSPDYEVVAPEQIGPLMAPYRSAPDR